VVDNGLGLHSGALTLDGAVNLGKVSEVLKLILNTLKTDVLLDSLSGRTLLLYVHQLDQRLAARYVLSNISQTNVKIGALFMGVISTTWMIILMGVSQGQCNPRKKAWAPWTAGTCINLKVMFLAVSVPNIITDITILALPLPNVWALQTNLRQRVLLIIIFLLGSFLSLQVSTALRSTWITTRTICRVSSRRNSPGLD
jgi:hypothetical protein